MPPVPLWLLLLLLLLQLAPTGRLACGRIEERTHTDGIIEFSGCPLAMCAIINNS